MVLDKENEKVHPRYLAYDIVRFQVSSSLCSWLISENGSFMIGPFECL